MAIPALLILKTIEQDDKAICQDFFPDIEEAQSHEGSEVAQLRILYEELKRRVGTYELYNLMEKCIIEAKLTD